MGGRWAIGGGPGWGAATRSPRGRAGWGEVGWGVALMNLGAAGPGSEPSE